MRSSRAGICAIAVMAKAPQPGRSKTRLAPPLSLAEAAALSAAFLRDITENIAAAAKLAPIEGYIAYAPAGLEALFDGHLAAGTRLVLADGGVAVPTGVEGFGRCLLHAIESLLAAGYGAACVLNSDSPTLPTAVLAEAAQRLAEPGDRAVFGPAEDGGYYLLGVKAAHAELFTGIDWSTERVAAQTLERAATASLEIVTLPRWYDVDDAGALARLRKELDAPPATGRLTPYAAAATAFCLARLGRAA